MAQLWSHDRLVKSFLNNNNNKKTSIRRRTKNKHPTTHVTIKQGSQFRTVSASTVRNKAISFRKIYRLYRAVSAVPENYIGFRPVNSYRTGKRQVFLSHSRLPLATITTFSTSSRGCGLILAVATSSLSLSLSLSLSRQTFSFSLSFSVFQTSQMIFSTPKK